MLIVLRFLLMLFMGFYAINSLGGVSLSKTRIIFNEDRKSVDITVHNDSNHVFLVQSSIKGLSCQCSDTSFIVSPPLFRIEHESQNILRIRRTNELPVDRESAYWLEILMIPASNKPGVSLQADNLITNRLGYAFSLAVKLFYRPDNLPLTVNQAYSKLKFYPVASGIMIENPTPYFITFSSLFFNGKPYQFNDENRMLKPFSKTTYHVENQHVEIVWSVLNDYGASLGEHHIFLN